MTSDELLQKIRAAGPDGLELPTDVTAVLCARVLVVRGLIERRRSGLAPSRYVERQKTK